MPPMMGLRQGIPPGAESGVFALAAFVADTEACLERLRELQAARDAAEAERIAAEATKAEAQVAAGDAARKLEELKAERLKAEAAIKNLDHERAKMRAELDAERHRLDVIAEGQVVAKRDLNQQEAMLVASEAAMRAANEQVAKALVEREQLAAELEANARAAMVEANALKAEHETLLANARKLLSGGEV